MTISCPEVEICFSSRRRVAHQSFRTNDPSIVRKVPRDNLFTGSSRSSAHFPLEKLGTEPQILLELFPLLLALPFIAPELVDTLVGVEISKIDLVGFDRSLA